MIEILEGVTVTNVGTQINYETTNTLGTFSNLNRQSEIKQDSILDIYYDCTYTGGLVYDREFIQAGGLKGDTGEFNSGTVERVLKPNTDYVIKITNTSTSADGVGHTRMTWYESGE